MTCGKIPPGRLPNECCDNHLPDTCCRTVVEAAELGRLQRDAGLGRALLADPEWVARALRAIRRRAKGGIPFTADEIRQDLGSPKEPNSMGAVFSAAAGQKLIRSIGTRRSGRTSARQRRVTLWLGSDHVAEQTTLTGTKGPA
ncbi:MAG: hypothetical protein ACRDIX_07290 [Actinomycetota bacterium]